jgi:hypothetical protein
VDVVAGRGGGARNSRLLLAWAAWAEWKNLQLQDEIGADLKRVDLKKKTVPLKNGLQVLLLFSFHVCQRLVVCALKDLSTWTGLHFGLKPSRLYCWRMHGCWPCMHKPWMMNLFWSILLHLI